MPIVLSAFSLRQRRYRKAAATRTSSTFSWVIFFIAVSTFTVWSLGASTCTTSAEHQQLLTYYRTEASFCKSFAAVLLLLQQISENIQHILPAVVTALLLSHTALLPHSQSTLPLDGSAQKAELVQAVSPKDLLKLLFLTSLGGAHTAEEAAAPTS